MGRGWSWNRSYNQSTGMQKFFFGNNIPKFSFFCNSVKAVYWILACNDYIPKHTGKFGKTCNSCIILLSSLGQTVEQHWNSPPSFFLSIHSWYRKYWSIALYRAQSISQFPVSQHKKSTCCSTEMILKGKQLSIFW